MSESTQLYLDSLNGPTEVEERGFFYPFTEDELAEMDAIVDNTDYYYDDDYDYDDE